MVGWHSWTLALFSRAAFRVTAYYTVTRPSDSHFDWHNKWRLINAHYSEGHSICRFGASARLDVVFVLNTAILGAQ
jgi:hypothetical protein